MRFYNIEAISHETFLDDFIFKEYRLLSLNQEMNNFDSLKVFIFIDIKLL